MLDHLPRPARDKAAWALFLDLDGTLLEIAARPGQVVVTDSVRQLLEQLRLRLDNATAIVSGRSVADIRRLVTNVEIDISGCHGAEMCVRDLSLEQCPPSRIHEVTDRIAKATNSLPGVFVESKPWSVALHYRATSLSQSEVKSIVETAIDDLLDEFRILLGKSIVEVVPKKVGKGLAISRLLTLERYKGRIPVFVGDDVTDEEGFCVVNALGGYSIHVGSSAKTIASFRAGSVSEVLSWLNGPVLEDLIRDVSKN